MESGQVVALAGDILRQKALNHILEQASPVDAQGEPVDLDPPGLDDDEDEPTEEELDGATAGSELSVDDAETSTAENEVSADE